MILCLKGELKGTTLMLENGQVIEVVLCYQRKYAQGKVFALLYKPCNAYILLETVAI